MIPYVLDDLTLTEVARGDADLIRLLLSYDAAGQALVVPVLAAAAAYRDNPSPEAGDSLRGLPELDHAISAPVSDVAQALRVSVAAARSRTGSMMGKHRHGRSSRSTRCIGSIPPCGTRSPHPAGLKASPSTPAAGRLWFWPLKAASVPAPHGGGTFPSAGR